MNEWILIIAGYISRQTVIWLLCNEDVMADGAKRWGGDEVGKGDVEAGPAQTES